MVIPFSLLFISVLSGPQHHGGCKEEREAGHVHAAAALPGGRFLYKGSCTLALLLAVTSSPTRPTCDTRNVLLLDVVSTNTLNIIKKEGCIKMICPAGGKKVFQQNWGNVFIYARQPVSVSIVHLPLPEGKLLLLL